MGHIAALRSPSAGTRAGARLTEAAVIALHAVSGVRKDLLRAAHIHPADRNWLRAPWYGYARGGALTMGRSIYFTRRYFDPHALADGSYKRANESYRSPQTNRTDPGA